MSSAERTRVVCAAFVRIMNFRSTKASVRLKLDVFVDGVLTHPMQQTLEVKPRKYVAPKDDEEEKDETSNEDAESEEE